MFAYNVWPPLRRAEAPGENDFTDDDLFSNIGRGPYPLSHDRSLGVGLNRASIVWTGPEPEQVEAEYFCFCHCALQLTDSDDEFFNAPDGAPSDSPDEDETRTCPRATPRRSAHFF